MAFIQLKWRAMAFKLNWLIATIHISFCVYSALFYTKNLQIFLVSLVQFFFFFFFSFLFRFCGFVWLQNHHKNPLRLLFLFTHHVRKITVWNFLKTTRVKAYKTLMHICLLLLPLQYHHRFFGFFTLLYGRKSPWHEIHKTNMPQAVDF